MTTPKQALEQIAARSIAQDDDDEKELRRQLYHIEALAKSALASLQGEDAVERMARIINPGAWRYVDDATRPYAENRGSSNGNGGENYWYERTYRAGCRSVSDVKKWLFERTLTPDDPLNITHIRESIAKARALIATGLVPDEAGGTAQQSDAAFDIEETRRENAENLRTLDAIADYVGCPHDEELTVDHVRQHYMKLENAAQQQGIEDAGRIANAQAYSAECEAAIRADEREKCARELETSYPGHAWLNAACAAIRSGGGE